MDKNNTKRFQSSQHIRLRSDQEHQAQIGNRIRMNAKIKESRGQKVLGDIVSRVSGSSGSKDDSEPVSSQFRFGDLRATSSDDDPHPLPGLKRLG